MATDPLEAHAQALLSDIVARSDVQDAAGTFDLQLRGQHLRVTVTADDEGPFTSGERIVRVLVEAGGRVGYAAGLHGGRGDRSAADGTA